MILHDCRLIPEKCKNFPNPRKERNVKINLKRGPVPRDQSPWFPTAFFSLSQEIQKQFGSLLRSNRQSLPVLRYSFSRAPYQNKKNLLVILVPAGFPRTAEK